MYMFYLYEAKYRLSFIETNEKKNIKNMIGNKIKESKDLYNYMTKHQKIKIKIYKLFNKLAFSYKLKKELKI